MAELAPLPLDAQPSLLAPLTEGGPPMDRARAFLGQPPVKKALPWFAGMSVLGGAALAWSMLAPAPQRVLYTRLDDGERASVVGALDKAKIGYHIDSSTGALTVDEGNVYRARMVVAQNGALALPDTAQDSLDKLPMGASRALEDERLRAAREHELMLSIKEIEGVQSVRVHLAEGQKSVFVRDQTPPSASVMLHLTEGRQLSDSQVTAIVNLVAGSVPGLTPDAVKVIDQRGRLLSAHEGQDTDRLEWQARLEEKLHGQVDALLTPMIGEGNFTNEIQVELDMAQVTSARETYDKQGVVRSEQQQQSSQPMPGQPAGVPGVLSNTPPPSPTPSAGPPTGTAPGAAASPVPNATESSAARTYELGREVAVTNMGPGKIKRLSVAVGLSQKALAKATPADIANIKNLVSAAVGADPTRGDQVTVVVRAFDTAVPENVPFYEKPWFMQALHYGGMLIGTLMVLLLGVRPLIKAISGDKPKPAKNAKDKAIEAEAAASEAEAGAAEPPGLATVSPRRIGAAAPEEEIEVIDAEVIGRHVGRAQQIVETKPDTAVIALRQMLQAPAEENPA